MCAFGLTLMATFMGYCSGVVMVIWLCSDLEKQLIQIPVDCGVKIRQVR